MVFPINFLMSKLGTQIWCAREHGVSLDVSKVGKVINFTRKPFGGLWTSSYTPNEEYCSEWIQWTCNEEPRWATGICYLLEPEDDIKVYTIDKAEDLEKLFEMYPRIVDNYAFDINWKQVCKDYDAIHLTSNGQWATRYETPKYGGKLNLYGWDTESTFWCRPKFKEIKYIDDVEHKCKVTCDIE